MGKIKDRNGMDLTEAEDIKKRWQEYTEVVHKKDHDPDNQVQFSSVQSLSHARLFATPWTVAYQVPPSMGFSRE